MNYFLMPSRDEREYRQAVDGYPKAVSNTQHLLQLPSLTQGDQAREVVGAPTQIGRRLTNAPTYSGRTEGMVLLEKVETFDAELLQEEDFFWFIHYSHATYGDHGENMYSPDPVRCPRSDGTLLAPLCAPPRPVPRRCGAHQGKYEGKEQMRKTNLPV